MFGFSFSGAIYHRKTPCDRVQLLHKTPFLVLYYVICSISSRTVTVVFLGVVLFFCYFPGAPLFRNYCAVSPLFRCFTVVLLFCRCSAFQCSWFYIMPHRSYKKNHKRWMFLFCLLFTTQAHDIYLLIYACLAIYGS